MICIFFGLGCSCQWKTLPVDIGKMHAKFDMLTVRIAKDKEKLAKLMKKQ
jgi:hypothetical protein